MAKKMTHCPTCKCRFEDISEGWRTIIGCPKCGLRQEDAERVITHQKQIEQKAPAPEPEPEPEPEPAPDAWTADCEWMRRLTLKMASEHGIQMRVTWGKAYSWHRQREGQPHRINYGAEDIFDTKTNGMREYPTWAHIWYQQSKIIRDRNVAVLVDMTGRKGLWGVALHEFGHAIAKENGHRVRGSAHNEGWASAVRDLQVLYPFDECKDL